jgi:hypothetical protein
MTEQPEVRHNHVTRDVKPPGQCPGCDASSGAEVSFKAVPDLEVGPAVIAASPGSRLEQLLASYESAKAAADEAKTRFEGLAEAIKAELAAQVPAGAGDILLSGPPSMPRLRMSWKSPYRFDVKRFRAENPVMYVRYETRGGHWELRQEK